MLFKPRRNTPATPTITWQLRHRKFSRMPQERSKSAARAKQSTDSRQLGGSVGRIWFSRQFVLYILFPTGNHRHDIPQRVCNSCHGQNMKPASGFRLTTTKATRNSVSSGNDGLIFYISKPLIFVTVFCKILGKQNRILGQRETIGAIVLWIAGL